MAVQPAISIEVFPPATPAGAERLGDALARLAQLRPEFVSVTYGADGSGQQGSLRLIDRLMADGELPLTAHLTCAGATRDEVDEVARGWRDAGIGRIAALRGDMPGGGAWRPHPNGYANAAELVAGLRRIGDFDIAVAAYPEIHPDSPGEAADTENLKAKIDAGANLILTQFCFDTDAFARLRDRVAAAGIAAPIVPGIMPITDFGRVANFARRCGTGVPDWLAQQFDGLDPRTSELVAASIATEQCQRLMREGFDRFHFFILNRAPMTLAVCRRLGIRPGLEEAA